MAPQAVADRTEPAEAEAWVRAFERGWLDPAGPEDAAARFERILDPNVRLIQPQIPDLVGLAEVRAGFFEPLFTLLPDAHATVERWSAQDDTIYLDPVPLLARIAARPRAWPAFVRYQLALLRHRRRRRSR